MADHTPLGRLLRRLASPVMRPLLGPVLARAADGEQRLGQRLDEGAAATAAALAALDARLAAIEARPAPPPQSAVDALWTHAHEHAASIQLLAARLDDVRADIAALAAAFDPLAADARRDRSELRALLNRYAVLEDAIAALRPDAAGRP